MLFVDGENLTIRAQKVAEANRLTLTEGANYRKDTFIWLPGIKPTIALVNNPGTPVKVEEHAIRAHYYTSVVGDQELFKSVRESLWSLGFHPEVFRKPSKDTKAKGVDIALTKDMLSHAFLNNYDVAILVAGDGDYVPLVEEVKRLGKVIYVLFFETNGISPELRVSSDMFFHLQERFLEQWNNGLRLTDNEVHL